MVVYVGPEAIDDFEIYHDIDVQFDKEDRHYGLSPLRIALALANVAVPIVEDIVTMLQPAGIHCLRSLLHTTGEHLQEHLGCPLLLCDYMIHVAWTYYLAYKLHGRRGYHGRLRLMLRGPKIRRTCDGVSMVQRTEED